MNKRQIIASLNNIANELDNTGLYKEANTLTDVMKRIAEEDRVPLDKMPGLFLDYKRGDEPTLVNFDPLLPAEGQEISRDELWEKFLEYLKEFKINVYDAYAYQMWNLLLKKHNMEQTTLRAYRNKLRNSENYQNQDSEPKEAETPAGESHKEVFELGPIDKSPNWWNTASGL
jgi:hypothetical protein